jgi:hypothetical protein
MLTREKCCIIEKRFGPHPVDLMALDSNCMVSRASRKPLKHFSPYPTLMSGSNNIFLKKILLIISLFYALFLPLVVYLKDIGVSVCTMVVPKLSPTPLCWPLIVGMCGYVCTWERGKHVLLFPTKPRFVGAKLSLMYDLIVVRLGGQAL